MMTIDPQQEHNKEEEQRAKRKKKRKKEHLDTRVLSPTQITTTGATQIQQVKKRVRDTDQAIRSRHLPMMSMMMLPS